MNMVRELLPSVPVSSQLMALLSCAVMSCLSRKERHRQPHEGCNDEDSQLLSVRGLDSVPFRATKSPTSQEASGRMNGKPLMSMLCATKLQTDLARFLRSPAEFAHCSVLKLMGQQALVSLEWALAFRNSPSASFWRFLIPREGLCCCVCVLGLFCSREESGKQHRGLS